VADNPYAKYANPYAGYVPVGVPDPTKPLDLKSKQLGVQKGEAELALTPYQLRKQAAEAAKAELDLQTKREAFDAAHPKGTGATVLGLDALKTMPLPDQEIVKALGRRPPRVSRWLRAPRPLVAAKARTGCAGLSDFDATNYNNRAKGRASMRLTASSALHQTR
jgi:hypothetical protein